MLVAPTLVASPSMRQRVTGTSHPQKYTKVNAPVDIEISGLVSALSAFPNLQTIESCQGGEGEGAWVCFTYGNHWEHPWRDISEFVFGFLGPKLAQEIGNVASVSIRVNGGGIAQGEMVVRPDGVKRTTIALNGLLQKFSA